MARQVLAVPLLLCFVVLLPVPSVRGQTPSDENFISINCGIEGGKDYMETNWNMTYTSDAGYVATGTNRRISQNYMGTLSKVYSTLRSFPNGTRNCYKLSPLQRGKKYLVRSSFLYGNYDGLEQPPKFDLYLGVEMWTKQLLANQTTVEIMAVVQDDFVHVCLVNTGTGTPFISLLELRPLADTMYPVVNASQSLVLLGDRQNYGANANISQIRFPDDLYDRVWFSAQNNYGWLPLSASEGEQVKVDADGMFIMPSAVMGTAVTTASLKTNLSVTVNLFSSPDPFYLFMHFAELRRLRANESCIFDVYINGGSSYRGYVPTYLTSSVLYTPRPQVGTTNTYSLVATADSTVPPILNALEVHYIRQRNQMTTDDRDVLAIQSIKQLYQVAKNWEGDPCVPREFMWEGLDCEVPVSQSPRIISLNLSSSDLAGPIPISLVNLTALKSLDLSHNRITGEIPTFLGDIPTLNFLNLKNNLLRGLIPQNLLNRSQDGLLSLSISDNPDLCTKAETCTRTEERKKKRKIVVPVIICVSVAVALLVILILAWFIKGARKQSTSENHELITQHKNPIDKHKQTSNLPSTKSHHFKFLEILNITHNLESVIGKGGFGTVYLAHLPDKSLAAVKLLSQSSSQGAKEFQSEAKVLTRVHHKNLVSLLGYCDDMNNMALVYEFMPQGSLALHLSGKTNTIEMLSWKVRLTIAFDSAQGLDYLHNGCKPSIVHRDVKTANILLSENFRAKLADFGLSKTFSNEEVTHVSTVVAGTPGYLDPEYYQTYRLNEKSDIYSFGVVLLEIITGKSPINGGVEKVHITQWVLSRIEKGDIDSIVDQRLQRKYDSNSMWKAVDIAMSCVSPLSIHRPSMSEVVIQLKDCLAIEEERNQSNVLMQSPGTNETIPLYMDSIVMSPFAR